MRERRERDDRNRDIDRNRERQDSGGLVEVSVYQIPSVFRRELVERDRGFRTIVMV